MGQRVRGCAKVLTQSSHNGREGQVRQIRHALGSRGDPRKNEVCLGATIREKSWPMAYRVRCNGPGRWWGKGIDQYTAAGMSETLEVNTSRPPLDPVAAQRWLDGRVPGALGGEAWLHGEVARRMEDRLQWIRLEPQRWVDWSPSLGGWEAADLIARRYPKAQRDVVEPADPRRVEALKRLTPPWWQPWKDGPQVLALPNPGQANMLWSNMALHAHPDPQALLQQWGAALSVDGFLMFSCLGPDSLREVRELYRQQGWPAPTHSLTDMHDWGDLLVQAGFAEPVMDMERITLTYQDAGALLADLRTLGRNLHPGRFGALRGRRWQKRLQSSLAVLASRSGDTSAPGRLSLTFEIIYGHAMKPAPRARVASETQLPLQDLKAMLAKRPTREG